MALPPKVCPRCGEEYVHTVDTCGTCQVPLVAEGQVSDEGGEALPPSSDLHSVRVASAGWALALSQRLVEAGIQHRVEAVEAPSRRGDPWGVFVRAEDLERARDLDAEQMRREIPDLPDDWEAASEGGEGCPACGAAVADDASECPDCGLALAGPE